MHMYISYASLHDCSPSTTDPKQLKSVFVCVCVCAWGGGGGGEGQAHSVHINQDKVPLMN